MAKGILRVDVKTRAAWVEGKYRTHDHMVRSWARLRGENTSKDISFLMGDVMEVRDISLRSDEEVITLITDLQIFGGWVVIPLEPELPNGVRNTFMVFVPRNLDYFLRQCGAYSDLEIDMLEEIGRAHV